MKREVCLCWFKREKSLRARPSLYRVTTKDQEMLFHCNI
jgi:hypothetical protein